jgi:dTMP kinase
MEKIRYPQLIEGARSLDLDPLKVGETIRGFELSRFIAGDSKVPGGVLIALEGIDGCGKTTLAHQLTRALSEVFNETVLLTAEPAVDFREGLSIIDRTYDIDEADCPDLCSVVLSMKRRLEALRLSMDHAIHMGQVVIPALLSGKIVVTDRWFWSSFCYQVERLEEVGDPEPFEFIAACHQGWDLRPDLTIHLTVPVDVAMSRLQGRYMKLQSEAHEYERKDLLIKVARRYANLAAEHSDTWITLNSNVTQQDLIFQAMDPAMNAILKKRGKGY